MSRITAFVFGAVLALGLGCGSNNGNNETNTCGDGICQPSEINTCPSDCGNGSGSGSNMGSDGTVCGNGVCESGENSTNCPSDCPVSMCGNGVCESGENSTNCPGDCGGGGGGDCDDGLCEYYEGENYANCPSDCVMTMCGSGSGAGSGSGSGSACVLPDSFDCSAHAEDCSLCFDDDDFGGLGFCDEDDDVSGGSAGDCAACAGEDAFGIDCAVACGSGETASCAACMDQDYVCGDGFCDASEGETVADCPVDCHPFDCTTASTQMACGTCFEDDFDDLGFCDEFEDAYPGSADDCAACVGSGVFGSGCESDCAGGESLACAGCMYVASLCGDGTCEYNDGETTVSCPMDCMATCGDGTCDTTDGETTGTCPTDCPFDCADSTIQTACATCFEDDASAFGECDFSAAALPGSAADCAACVGSGAFGSDGACESACAGGETLACAQCVYTLTTCGDATCEFETGENHTNCPADCAATVCGDGRCDALNGENSTSCAADCDLADAFDCSSSVNRDDCSECFFEDDDHEGGMLGDCDADHDVRNGSAADCAACVHIDAFGSACIASCGSDGETIGCARCADD